MQKDFMKAWQHFLFSAQPNLRVDLYIELAFPVKLYLILMTNSKPI